MLLIEITLLELFKSMQSPVKWAKEIQNHMSSG
jgi:hypothetical protein